VPVNQVYRTNTQAILLAARDLEEALDAGDDEDVPSLAGNLLSAALAREAGGVVAGFQARDAAPTGPAPGLATVEEALSLTLTELEIGGVLLTGSAAVVLREPVTGTPTGDAAPTSDVTAALNEAIDNLDDATTHLARAGTPTVSGLFGESQPDPEEFFARLPKTVDHIVDRTVKVGRTAVTGLTKIPAAQLQPVFTSALSLVPDVGALAKAGMRAVARALDALARLVPEKLREQVREWARKWWKQRGEAFFDRTVRKALSVAELEAAIKTAVEAAQQRDDLPEGPLRQGVSRLLEIDERHSRVTKVIERIVGALSRLIGPLVTLVPVGAPWIYLSGGGGLITALGIAVWIGRDYLDTGVPLERVQGIRTILTTATT
jgi:hypothetical protein